jgi:hypothetical protein
MNIIKSPAMLLASVFTIGCVIYLSSDEQEESAKKTNKKAKQMIVPIKQEPTKGELFNINSRSNQHIATIFSK